MPELNWRVIAIGETKRQRLAILERMLTPPPEGDPGWSAVEIAKLHGETLGTTAHHMRLLRDRGWIVEVGTRASRGALQRFYVLAPELVSRD